jgi:predicted small metal-binding protein
MSCDFETTAATEAKLMKNIATHVLTAHKMISMPPDIMAKVKAAIQK